MGIIYLLKTREFVNSNQNVFKIGKSSKQGISRINQYPKGSVLYFLITVLNEDLIEHKIIELFSIQFIHKKEYGNEYFEGDYVEMIDKINFIIQENKTCELSTVENEIIKQPIINYDKNIIKLIKSKSSYFIEYLDSSNLKLKVNNGFITYLLRKNIITINSEPVNINYLLTEIKKQKYTINLEHFDIFCSIYGNGSISEGIDQLFEDTVINDLFYATTCIGKFNNKIYSVGESRNYILNINVDSIKKFHNENPLYKEYICIEENNYTIINICYFNNYYFCTNLLFKYIPMEMCIGNDKIAFKALHGDYIGFSEHFIPKFNQIIIEKLYEPPNYPWNSKKLHGEYVLKLKKLYLKYNVHETINSEKSLDLYYTFINKYDIDNYVIDNIERSKRRLGISSTNTTNNNVIKLVVANNESILQNDIDCVIQQIEYEQSINRPHDCGYIIMVSLLSSFQKILNTHPENKNIIVSSAKAMISQIFTKDGWVKKYTDHIVEEAFMIRSLQLYNLKQRINDTKPGIIDEGSWEILKQFHEEGFGLLSKYKREVKSIFKLSLLN